MSFILKKKNNIIYDSKVYCFQLSLLLLCKWLLGEDFIMEAVVFAYSQLWQTSVQPLQQHTCLTQFLTGDVATPAAGSLDRHLYPLAHRQVLTGVNNVHDRTGPHTLQIL